MWLLLDEVQEAAKAEFSRVAREKGIKLLEREAIVDHVHLLLDLDDVGRLPRAMNDLKGISARRLFEQFPDIKLDAHTNHFWQEGYGSKIVAPHAVATTRRYIQTQWERVDNYEDRAKPRP
jgi:putative transposase